VSGHLSKRRRARIGVGKVTFAASWSLGSSVSTVLEKSFSGLKAASAILTVLVANLGVAGTLRFGVGGGNREVIEL